MPAVRIVFDIDGVLALIDKDSTTRYSPETVAFFSSHQSILNLDCGPPNTYYLLPGALELMQLLFSLPKVDIVFFSAGTDDRNKSLVKQLLIRALGSEHYERVAAEIMILSRNQLTRRKAIAPEILKAQFDTYGLTSLNIYKKDLTKGIPPIIPPNI
jgi:hypothetical protein